MNYKKKAVFAIYRNRDEVNRAIRELQARGFRNSEFHVLLPKHEGPKDFPQRQRTLVKTGALLGSVVGFAVFGLVSLLISARIIPIPGIDTLAFEQKVTFSLSGFIIGGFIGAGIGALIGIGTPEPAGLRYSTYVAVGGILLSVHVNDEVSERRAKDVLEKTGGQDISVLDEDVAWQLVYSGVPRASSSG